MFQKEYWANERVAIKRRLPLHPVIEAFAAPKVTRILEIIRQHGGQELKRQTSLLDVGCGNGYFSYYFNQHMDVTCLDYSYTMLNACPLNKRIQASALHMPFKDSSFDIVFCANLLHHLRDPLAAVREMGRVSARYIAIVEPNRANPFMFAFSFISRADKYVRKFSKKYVVALCGSSGVGTVIDCIPAGMILPNRTPLWLLSMLKKMEQFLYPKLFHLVVIAKNEP